MAKAPGKNHRKGITIKQLLRKSPTAAKAEEWIVKQRWARGVCCPHCGSLNVQTGWPAQDHAVPLPGKDLREAIQHQDGHGHGRLEDRLSGLDCRRVPGHDQPQERVEHEAPPRLGNHPEVSLVSGSATACRIV